MSKILISFLGTGRSKDKRAYNTAKYKFGDDSPEESTFVAKVLAEKEHIDKFFLIGTPQSIWEEVYASFSGSENDEDIWSEIGDYCCRADRNTTMSIPHKEEIEAALGCGSKVVLVHYGLDEKEIKDNLEIVLGLVNDLNQGDEIIIDITHSFRSLPLIIMNLLFYLRTVNNPKVRISHIYYGMLEVSRELGYAPIIDLKQVLEVTDWTLGAYSFHEFGISKQICGLTKDKSVSNALERFSSLLSLNYLGPLQQEAQRLSALKNHKYDSLFESMTVKPVVDDFIKTFGNEKEPHKFQYKLARWQYEKFNYLASMTTLLEATITYTCVTNNLDWQDYDSRNYCKEMLRTRNDQDGSLKLDYDLCIIFNSINSKRNNLVHQNTQSRNQPCDVYVKSIKDNLDKFSDLIADI